MGCAVTVFEHDFEKYFDEAIEYLEDFNMKVFDEAEEIEEIVIETNIEHDFICSLCNGIIVDPVTTSCKHSFCQACLKKAGNNW